MASRIIASLHGGWWLLLGRRGRHHLRVEHAIELAARKLTYLEHKIALLPSLPAAEDRCFRRIEDKLRDRETSLSSLCVLLHQISCVVQRRVAVAEQDEGEMLDVRGFSMGVADLNIAPWRHGRFWASPSLRCRPCLPNAHSTN